MGAPARAEVGERRAGDDQEIKALGRRMAWLGERKGHDMSAWDTGNRVAGARTSFERKIRLGIVIALYFFGYNLSNNNNNSFYLWSIHSMPGTIPMVVT